MRIYGYYVRVQGPKQNGVRAQIPSIFWYLGPKPYHLGPWTPKEFSEGFFLAAQQYLLAQA